MATGCYEVDNASHLPVFISSLRIKCSYLRTVGSVMSARARGEMNGGHNVANLKLPCKYKQQPPICPPHN